MPANHSLVSATIKGRVSSKIRVRGNSNQNQINQICGRNRSPKIGTENFGFYFSEARQFKNALHFPSVSAAWLCVLLPGFWSYATHVQTFTHTKMAATFLFYTLTSKMVGGLLQAPRS